MSVDKQTVQTVFVTEYPNRMKELQEQRALKNPKPEVDKIMSREEAAEYLSVSLSTLDRMIRDKKIPVYRVAGRVLFSKRRLDEWKLAKEELPEGWESVSFKKDLQKKEEALRLAVIDKKRDELGILADRVYQALESGKLDNPQRAEHDRILTSLAEEVASLRLEENEIKKKQLGRLKSLLGIEDDK